MGRKGAREEKGAEAKLCQDRIVNTSNNPEEDMEWERMNRQISVLPLKHVLFLTGYQ